MSNLGKIIAVGAAVLVIFTLGILWFTGRTPTADMGAESVFQTLEFHSKAREACAEIFKDKAKLELGDAQFDTVSDGKSQATFTWRGDSTTPFQKIVCKYEKGKGVTGLAMDDKTLVSRQ